MGAQPWWRFLALLLPLLVAVVMRVARFLNMSRRRDGSSSWSYVMGNKGGGQHQVGRGDEGNSALLSIFT
uniref:Uncharacterized protein n=3 Tax=Oryza TaxID=4527 RepID=A0A0D3F4G4_9ORYZ